MPKTEATIRGDQLLLALNVIDIGTWPIENWRAHPEWFAEDNPLGLDVEKTHQVLCDVVGWISCSRLATRIPRRIPHLDVYAKLLYPFLRANAEGIRDAVFTIESVVAQHRHGRMKGLLSFEEDVQPVRHLLRRIGSGELTLADFQA